MTDVLIAPKYELTKDDLKLIAEVAEETAKTGSPIALLRGPETMETLRKWFPTNHGWAKLQKLGTERPVGKLPTGEPLSIYTKRVERLFVGSKKWPHGIPAGCADVRQKRSMDSDDYKQSVSVYDFTFAQEERLRFMSEGKRRMTDAEIKADAERKAELRDRLYETSAFQTPGEQAGNAIADVLKKFMAQSQSAAPEKK